jgi:protein required for attachment to host cells
MKVIFFKKCSKLPFLAQEAKTKNKIKYFFAILIVGSCPRLLGEHVQKVSKKLTARIITFEVERKVIYLVLSRDRRP